VSLERGIRIRERGIVALLLANAGMLVSFECPGVQFASNSIDTTRPLLGAMARFRVELDEALDASPDPVPTDPTLQAPGT
jgi:hypothetical protein